MRVLEMGERGCMANMGARVRARVVRLAVGEAEADMWAPHGSETEKRERMCGVLRSDGTRSDEADKT